MRKPLIVIWILLIFFKGLSLQAQLVLSLEKARELALEHDPESQAALLRQQQARQQLLAARSLRLPAFSASGTALYQNRDVSMDMILPTQVLNPETGQLEPNLFLHPVTGQPVMGPDGNPLFNMYAWLPLNISLNGAYLLSAGFEQPVYAGGRIHSAGKMAGIGVEMAAENLRLKNINTLVQVDDAYWTYVKLSQHWQLARQAVDMLASYEQMARNALETGMGKHNDLLKVQLEHGRARLSLQEARNGLELSRMNLCRMLGIPFDTSIVASDSLGFQPGSLNTLNREATLELRPEYQLLSQQLRMSQEQIRMTRAEFLPLAGIQAGYQHIAGVQISGTDFSNSSFQAMASLKIPLFQWGQGLRKISAARIDYQIKALEQQQYHELMQLEASQARLNLQLAIERIQLCELALKQATENLRVNRDNYSLGMETMSELLRAQTHYQQARADLIDARACWHQSQTRWLRASGRLE